MVGSNVRDYISLEYQPVPKAIFRNTRVSMAAESPNKSSYLEYCLVSSIIEKRDRL